MKSLITAVTPIIVIMCCIVWALTKKNTSNEEKTNTAVSAILVVLIVLQTTLAKTSIELFSCKQFVYPAIGQHDKDFSAYLTQDLHYKCKGDKTLQWSMGMGVPMLLLYTFGIPIFCAAILWCHRYSLTDDAVKGRFGFLYKGFEHKYYYWESLIMARKVSTAQSSLRCISKHIIEHVPMRHNQKKVTNRC